MTNYTIRFWEQVEKTDACWTWTGKQMNGGYGKATHGGRTTGAHRIAYEMTGVTIPDGMFLDHICSNRLCVNPAHLREVTRKQNSEHLTGPYKCNQTGYRGVEKRGDRYRAAVRHNKKLHYLGTFDTAEEAAAVAAAKRNELFTHNDRDRNAA